MERYWVSLLLAVSIASACSKPASTPTTTSGSGKATSAAISSVPAATSTTATADTSTPPSFDTANLGVGFNRSDAPAAAAADPSNIMIRVLHTNYYRPVFLNLLDKIETFSIYQPMPITEVRGGASNVQIDSYYIAGHAYSKQVGYPDHATLMMAYETDPNVLAPPKSYTRIWSLEASIKANDLFSKCGGLGEHGAAPDPVTTTKCQGLGSSVTSSFGTTVFDYQQLFDVLAVFFWKPTPYDGFRCLGHITSNGNGDQPVTELDVAQQFSGLGTTLNPNITVSAMYCVKQDYVVEGKIGNILFQSADKTLAVYEIRAKTGTTGFDGGNLFYAQSCPSGVLANCPITEKVYVLDQKYMQDIGTEGSSTK